MSALPVAHQRPRVPYRRIAALIALAAFIALALSTVWIWLQPDEADSIVHELSVDPAGTVVQPFTDMGLRGWIVRLPGDEVRPLRP